MVGRFEKQKELRTAGRSLRIASSRHKSDASQYSGILADVSATSLAKQGIHDGGPLQTGIGAPYSNNQQRNSKTLPQHAG